MGFLKTTIAAAAVASVPFAFAAGQAQSSTVTGSVVLQLEGTVIGTIVNEVITEVTFSGGVPTDAGPTAGGFSTINSLSSTSQQSSLGWMVDSVLTYDGSPFQEAPQNNVATVEAFDPTPRSVGQLTSFYNDPMIVSLFTAYPFARNAINSAFLAGGDDNGTGTISGAKVDWNVWNAAVTGANPLTLEGGFRFSADGMDVLPFLQTFGFEQISRDPALAQGRDFTLTLTVQPIPVPAALPLLAGGLGILGFMGWRRRQRAEAA